jgi:hypothetical protein
MTSTGGKEEGGDGHGIGISPRERHEMIAVAAYFRAERRGFAPGGEFRDWWEATVAIDRMLERMSREGMTRREYQRVGLPNALRLWLDPLTAPGTLDPPPESGEGAQRASVPTKDARNSDL